MKMVKKIVTLLLTVVLLASVFAIPAFAEESETLSLNECLMFSVDFRTGDAKDRVTGSTPIYPQVPSITDADGNEAYVTEVVYVDDATLSEKVAHFNGTYSLGYPIDHSKLANNFTVEAYVMLGPGQGRWAMLCGTTWMQKQEAVNGFALCTSKMPLADINSDKFDDDLKNKSNSVGHPRNYLYSWTIGNGAEGSINYGFPGTGKNSVEADSFKNLWTHVVYTHNGSTEKLFINGEKLIDQEARIPEITHDTSNEMAELFRIGGYNWANNWDLDDGYVAYVNVYEVPLESDDEATELYENRNNIIGDVPSKDPVENQPSDQPGDQPTDEPSDSTPTDEPADSTPTDKPADSKPTEKPSTNKPGNAQTFDIGLISLAAVTLSTAVLAKRRRK